jgi:hypothetical protein
MHKPSSIKTTVYGRNNDKITGDIQKQLTLFYVTVYEKHLMIVSHCTQETNILR